MDWIYKSSEIITDIVALSNQDLKIVFIHRMNLTHHTDDDFDFSAIIQLKALDVDSKERLNLEIKYNYVIVDPSAKEANFIIPEIFYDAFNRLNSEYLRRIEGNRLEELIPSISPDFDQHIKRFVDSMH